MVKESEESNAAVDEDIHDPMKNRLLLKVMPVKAVPTGRTNHPNAHDRSAVVRVDGPWTSTRIRVCGPGNLIFIFSAVYGIILILVEPQKRGITSSAPMIPRRYRLARGG